MDLLAQVPEEHLARVPGEKGGMELVNPEEMAALVAALPSAPARAAGGSAGNTTFALAEMGMPCAFLGQLGQDAMGELYQSLFAKLGGDVSRFKHTGAAPTAQCLSLITPDSERTMRTDLGAALLIDPASVGAADFEGYGHAHMEGYLLFNPILTEQMLKCAKAAGCTVSVDLGSFEVVRAAGKNLPGLLDTYVDAVFANEDEAEAFVGNADPEAALEALGKLCGTVAVKLGADGAHLLRDGERCFSEVVPVDRVVDTTGAGDFWAAGFLYGHLTGLPLAACGRLGARLGGEVVQAIGAELDAAAWDRVRAEMAAVGAV